MKKIEKIVVLGGGLSTERQVSLVTAITVCKTLRKLGYKAIFIDLFLGLENYSGDLNLLFEDENGLCNDVEIGKTLPDLETVKISRKLKSFSRIGENVIEVCKLADCVFLGLHGSDGEDGKIQACLDLFGIPYTGSDALGSAIAMDKFMAKKFMMAHKIAVAPFVDQAPCVLKCVHGGSSIGTFICNTNDELKKSILIAESINDEYYIEQKIDGIEITVPVLDGKALTPIEIVPPDSGKFDYIAKYQNGVSAAQEICPARLTTDKTKEVQLIAEEIHKILKLSVYSRTDFIMDKKGKFYFLEINTLPGLTPNSLFPKAAKENGIDYAQLCELIVRLSLKERKNFFDSLSL